MKKVIFTLLLGFTAFCTYAQPSKAEMAQVQYGKAEEFFAAANYIECLNWLQKAETSVGENNPKIQHLRVKAHYAKKDLLEAFEACNVYFNLPTVTKGSDKYNEIMNIYVELEPQAEQLRATKERIESKKKEQLINLKSLLNEGGLSEEFYLGMKLPQNFTLSPSTPTGFNDELTSHFYTQQSSIKNSRLRYYTFFEPDFLTGKPTKKSIQIKTSEHTYFEVVPKSLVFLDSTLIKIELVGFYGGYDNTLTGTSKATEIIKCKGFNFDVFRMEMSNTYGFPQNSTGDKCCVFKEDNGNTGGKSMKNIIIA